MQVARNIATTLLTQVVTWVLALAVALYVPKYLGPKGYGEFSFAASVSMVVTALVQLGLSQLMVIRIARDHSKTAELTAGALVLRGALALVVGPLAILLVSFFVTRIEVDLVAVYMVNMMASVLNDCLKSGITGQEKLTRTNAAALSGTVVSSGLVILLVVLRAPILVLAGVATVGTLITATLNIYALRHVWRQMRWPSFAAIRSLAIESIPFYGWQLSRTLYGFTDPVVIRFVAGAAAAGFYSVAFRLIGTTLFLPVALTTALQPTLSRLHKDSPAEYKALSRRLLSMVLMASIPMSAVLISMPGRVMALLPYRHTFGAAIPVLQVGGIGIVLWYASNVLGTMAIAEHRQKAMFKISVMAACLGIPLCIGFSWFGLHWWHSAAQGAILSDVLLELFLIANYLRILPSDSFGIDSLKLIFKCLVAAAPMGACLALARPLHLGIWVVFPCVLVYAVMCWVLGCIGPKDLSIARQVLQRKAGA